MRMLLSIVLVGFTAVTALAITRTDVIIESVKRQVVTVGSSCITLEIKTEADKIWVRFNGCAEWQKIVKVSGFNSNDTNRTLIWQGRRCNLYYVDDLGVPSGKIKLAVIED